MNKKGGNAMDESRDLSAFRDRLMQRRNEILQFREEIDTSWKTLHEPEVEIEERAQKEHTAQALEQLDNLHKEEIVAIDEALGRIETGSYGLCESCGRRISSERLEALPYTRLCRFCADASPKEEPGAGIDATEGAGRTALPPELRGLKDDQLVEVILDRLRNDGRVELEELQISCSNGTVFLEGALPAETSRQALMDLLDNTLGLPKVLDHTEINPLLWERRDRTPSASENPPRKTEQEVLLQGEDVNEDIYVSETDGDPVIPPDQLLPEKEE